MMTSINYYHACMLGPAEWLLEGEDCPMQDLGDRAILG